MKIGIFTWHGVTKAYSCLLYLHKELSDNNDVEIWSFNKKEDFDEGKPSFIHTFLDCWYGSIKRVRVYMGRLHFLIAALHLNVIVINDLDFFKAGYVIKRICPSKIIIHYNNEICGADVKYPLHMESFYKKHADFPDIIIECLQERAEYRKEAFHIDKGIYVINNTLPATEVEKALRKNIDLSAYLNFENKEVPTLVYAGGCNLSRSLGDIIKCADDFADSLNFLFFCYGKEEDFSRVQELCDKHRNCYLYHAVDRITLLNVMAHCDIGIQYYDPDYSINHYLAAPSKFFEYISVGLNVLSSNNHGIDRMIADYDLGVCFTKDEGIKGGIEKLLRKGLNSRENIKTAFKEHLCYEVDSKEAIAAIKKLIDKN